MASTGNNNLYHINTGILKKDACVVLVKTEWNHHIVDQLEAGCLRVLDEYEIPHETIVVPGAVEIPFAIQHYWNTCGNAKQPGSFIALGCVIQGGTPHFEYVCKIVTEGIGQLNLILPVPTIFGVLTVNNEEQALERVGGKEGDKGAEAAITALKMMAL